MTELTNLQEPVFSASIYAGGQLDQVLTEVVAPFYRDVTQEDPEAGIWAVRYSRRGEHLKLRAHSASLQAEDLEARLRHFAEGFWAEQSPSDGERVARFDIPAIDSEDEPNEAVPDRTVQVTAYRRSQVTLGAQTFLDHDDIVAAMHKALAAGFARCLGLSAEQLAGQRQNLLAKTQLDAVLSAMDRATAVDYLAYHRNWLLRFFVPNTKREEQLTAHFEERVQAMGPLVDRLRQMEPEAAGDPWVDAVADLLRTLEPYAEDPAFDLDPFAGARWQPAFFKVVHGVANSFGVRPMDEAFICHLLHTALSGVAADSDGEA